MCAGIGKCSKIRHIVRLHQMLRRWRNKARASAGLVAPSGVPSGHVAVRVGRERTRFVVLATHLNHPVFRRLLVRAEEEYGFDHHGPLTIPVDESLFEEAVRLASRSEELQRHCHAGARRAIDLWPESRPLLHGLADEPVW